MQICCETVDSVTRWFSDLFFSLFLSFFVPPIEGVAVCRHSRRQRRRITEVKKKEKRKNELVRQAVKNSVDFSISQSIDQLFIQCVLYQGQLNVLYVNQTFHNKIKTNLIDSSV